MFLFEAAVRLLNHLGFASRFPAIAGDAGKREGLAGEVAAEASRVRIDRRRGDAA